MMQYVAYEPTVEIVGRAILATTGGPDDLTLDALQRRGVSAVDPDGWYPQQVWLDVLKELDQGGMLNMVMVGMKIPDSLTLPAQVGSVEGALASLDEVHHAHHRGGEIGHYRCEHVAEHHVRMVCDSPYPSDLDYGIVFATTRRYVGRGRAFTVVRAASPSRRHGDDCCIYMIKW